jgi:nicotinamidase/pyrazinamidase
MAEALIVVDYQNDFARPDGALSVPAGEEVAGHINELAASGAYDLVLATRDWHPPDHGSFTAQGGIWPVHCVRDTWGAGFHPHLEVRGEVVRKGTGGEDGYSGFTMRDPESGVERSTGLEGLLRGKGVARVVVVGLATDYCVRATALDALGLGFHVVVPADAVAAVDLDPGDGAVALQELASAGAVVG